MAVRFIIGRAGSGKTHHCLEAVRDRLQQDPIEGPRLILLVPEQASLQMERAIVGCHSGDIPGAHRAEVFSFHRLAYRVLDSVQGLSPRALTEPARAMVLRHVLAQRSEQLQYYRRVAGPGVAGGRLGGFIDRLNATIRELIQEAVEPQELVDLAEQTEPQAPARGVSPVAGAPGSAPRDPVQQAKLHDLQLIYQAYLDYLGTDRLDPSQYLQVARERFPRCDWLNGARLWVDGFASLSGQETLTLVALARMCQHVDITVMMDPCLCEAEPSRTASARTIERLFTKTSRTHLDLHRLLIRAGLEVEDPLIFDARPPPRFRANDSLARLERLLFMPADLAGTGGDGPPATVELIELTSRRIEVDYAVSRVCRWVQEAGTNYRYRDVAIIVRDLEPYHDLLSEALAARGVPFFIDRRRPVAHHPLVELLRAGTALAAQAMSLESVRLALKTGLFPISIEAADELENYLLAHGLSGFDVWRGDDWSFRDRSSFAKAEDEPEAGETEAIARINKTRRTLLQSLDAWLTFALSEKTHTGSAWVAAVVEWFDRLKVSQTLKGWAQQAEGDGDLDRAEEHRQVWRDAISFLDDLAFAFADVALTVEELADVLEAGLSGLTLGLVPPMVDQVLVGSIERSRHPQIKAALILGFNDTVFPRQLTEDSILNDDDRAMLQEAGVRLGAPSRERVFDESMLAYVALTRASEALVVTYATADNNGKSLRPSPFVDELCAACPGLKATTIGDPIRLRQTWDILSERDLASRLTMEFRQRPRRERDDLRSRGRWNELYDALRANLKEESGSRRAWRSLDEHDDARIASATIERLFAGPLRTSVSELETYAACPFQHFARYILRLRERAEAILQPVDVGQVHHAILEDFVNTVSTRGQGFGRLSDSELSDGLRESCARVAARLPTEGVLSNARNAYLLRRSASSLARVIRAQRKLWQSGSQCPRATELPFGFDKPGSLPAMELSTPAGRRVLIRGYIDRVDLVELSDELLGIVIDYKRTRDKHLDLSMVYHGLSLQLPGYLLALAASGETLAGRQIRPIGGLYVSLVSQYHSVDHPDLISPRDRAAGGTYRPRGLLLADEFTTLDNSPESGWSQHYNLFRKKDGAIGRIDDSDAADATSFQATLDRTRFKLGQLADGILDGRVAVSPYRLGSFSPCSWCPMTAVCRFEMGISEVRFLESLKRSEVFRRFEGLEVQGSKV